MGFEDLDDGDEDEQTRNLGLFQIDQSVRGYPNRKRRRNRRARRSRARRSRNTGRKRGRRCARMKPDCGLLHDTFASLWGEMKDAVEKLESEMQADKEAHDLMNDDLNALKAKYTTEKGYWEDFEMSTLAAKTSKIAMQ